MWFVPGAWAHRSHIGRASNLHPIGAGVRLIPTVGALLWLFAGRPVDESRPVSTTRFGEYDRPGRHIAANPDDDEAFLRGLRERAEQQRREARRQQEERDQDPA